MIREIGNTIQEDIFEDNNELTKKTNFSNNWITTFLRTYKLNYSKLSGETNSNDSEAALEFVNNFPSIAESYKPENIFNIDETCVMLVAQNQYSYSINNNQNKPKKDSKKITPQFGGSIYGEKFPLLIIGKIKKVKNRRKNNIINKNKKNTLYYSNDAVWITKEIFHEYLTHINRVMIN